MTAAGILAAVAAESGVSVEDIKGPSRLSVIVSARRIAARRLREAGLSYPAIGRFLGGRHHTSAMYLCGEFDEYRVAQVLRQMDQEQARAA